MMSVNLIFHISSGLAFFILIYFLLRQQRSLRFHAELWAYLSEHEARRPVLVDWPRRFFERLSQAWQFPLQWPETSEAAAQRIDPKAWVACHAALGIRAIERGEGQRLRVAVNRPELAGEWPSLLSQALGNRFVVEVRAFEGRAGLAAP